MAAGLVLPGEIEFEAMTGADIHDFPGISWEISGIDR